MRKAREAARWKAGFVKVEKCCEKARQDGYQYIWIDTCCIDKRSSAELSEAINSMYLWYQNSEVCYAYLSDVPSDGPLSEEGDFEAFSMSRWFTRGWTLQELIAPREIRFLGSDWRVIGVKAYQGDYNEESATTTPHHTAFLSGIVEITGIPVELLLDHALVKHFHAAQRMSWAAKRHTTRDEDLAYSLMGIFNVNMPILYGEGIEKAFRRLQLQIIQMTTDQSFFVWRADRKTSGLLAETPRDFAQSDLPFEWDKTALEAYSMTNMGLLLHARLITLTDSYYLLALRSWVKIGEESKRICLFLKQYTLNHPYNSSNPNAPKIYRRVRCHVFDVDLLMGKGIERKDIYILENEQYEHLRFVD